METRTDSKKRINYYLRCVLAMLLSISLVMTQSTLGYATGVGAGDGTQDQAQNENAAIPFTEDEEGTAKAQEQIKAEQDASENAGVSGNVVDGSIADDAEEMVFEDASDESASGNPFEFVYEDNVKTVTVRVSNPSALPAGARLVVDELSATTDNEAFTQAKDELFSFADSKGKTVASYTIYDIHFTKNGEEVELASGTAHVNVTYKDYLPMASTADIDGRQLALVHMDEKADGSVEPEEVSADFQTEYGTAIKSASFKTSGFSAYALAVLQESAQINIELAFTDVLDTPTQIDGTYGVYLKQKDTDASIVVPLNNNSGDIRTASINQIFDGGNRVPLTAGDYEISIVSASEQISEMPKPADGMQVYGPGESIMNDYALADNLSYSIGDGTASIRIVAKWGGDNSEIVDPMRSSNLNEFLESMEVYEGDNPDPVDLEKDGIKLNETYKYVFSFAEKPGKVLEYTQDGDGQNYLAYQMPESIQVKDSFVGKENYRPIKVGDNACGRFWFENVEDDQGNTHQEMRVVFDNVDENGNWADKNFIDMGEVEFSVNFTGMFKADETGKVEIPLGTDIDLEVKLIPTGEPSLSKAALKCDPNNNTMYYQVEFKAVNGPLKDVVITDTPGAGIKSIKADTVKVKKGDEDIEGFEASIDDKGRLVLSFPNTTFEMNDTYTITYEAELDYSIKDQTGSAAHKDDGSIYVENTADVSVVPVGSEEAKTVTAPSKFRYYPGSLQKWGAQEGDGTIKWSITVGDDFYPARDLTITDAFVKGGQIKFAEDKRMHVYGVDGNGKVDYDHGVEIDYPDVKYGSLEGYDASLGQFSNFQLNIGEAVEKVDGGKELLDKYNQLRIEYYTELNEENGSLVGTYENAAAIKIEDHAVIKWAKVEVLSGEADIKKEGELKSNSAYFTLKVDVPANFDGASLYIDDNLYDVNGSNLGASHVQNLPVIDEVYLTNGYGNSEGDGEVLGYFGAYPTEGDLGTYIVGDQSEYGSNAVGLFRISFNCDENGLLDTSQSKWNYNEASRLIIKYHVPLTAQIIDNNGASVGETVVDRMNSGNYLYNTAELHANTLYDDDHVSLSQRSDLTKNGTVDPENNKIDYEVVMYSSGIVADGSSSGYKYTSILGEGDGATMVFEDTFDANLEFMPETFEFGAYYYFNLNETEDAYKFHLKKDAKWDEIDNKDGTKTIRIPVTELVNRGGLNLAQGFNEFIDKETGWANAPHIIHRDIMNYKWTYSMSYTDDYIKSQQISPVPFENEAKISWGQDEYNRAVIDAIDVTEVKTDVLSKVVPEGGYDPDTNTVTYNIGINGNAEKLSVDGKAVNVYDKLPASLQLLTQSESVWVEEWVPSGDDPTQGDWVKLPLSTEVEDSSSKSWSMGYIGPLTSEDVGKSIGNECEILPEDVGKSLLIVSVPDETKLRLSYKCNVVSVAGQSKVEVDNTVQMSYSKASSDAAKNEFEVKEGGGEGKVTNGKFNIRKVSQNGEDAIPTVMKDVSFDVYGTTPVSVSGTDLPKGSSFIQNGVAYYYYGTSTTNSQGSCTITGVPNDAPLSANASVILVEHVPVGYESAHTATVNGKEINYNLYQYYYNGETGDAVTSDGVPSIGYGDTTTISNTPKVTNLSVEKVWVDGEDSDGVRPDSITVKVLKSVDGSEFTDSGIELVLNDDNDWWASTGNLPIYEGDQEIKYSVEEIEAGGDYESITIPNGNHYVITNTLLTSISVKKVWNDSSNADGQRPESITLVLKGTDGSTREQLIKASDFSEGNEWSYTFVNLPKYGSNGLIDYSVDEISIDGYVATVSEDGLTITNTPTTSVSGEKTWVTDQQELPSSIEVSLIQRDTAGTERVFDTKTVSEEQGWHYTFDKLPKYDTNGVEYAYSIDEVSVDDFISKVDGYDLKNISTETTDITGKKVWKGDIKSMRPDSITVQLLRNVNHLVGTAEDSDEATKQIEIDGEMKDVITIGTDAYVLVADQNVTPNAADEWTFTFDDLRVFDNDGNKIEYRVTDSVDGYTSSVEGANGNWTLTNEAEMTSFDLSFGKYFFSENPVSCDFTLSKAVDVTLDGDVPTGYKVEGDNLQTKTIDAGAYNGGIYAQINFDAIEIPIEESAVYWYEVREIAPEANPSYVFDTSTYLVEVSFVKDEQSNSNKLQTTYWYRYDESEPFQKVEEAVPGDDGELNFYNNQMMMLSGFGRSFQAMSYFDEPLQAAWVDPQVTKELIGAELKDGEFAFQLAELMLDGNNVQQESVIATGTNDAYGVVNFPNVSAKAETSHVLNYEEPGDYWYAIREMTSTPNQHVGVQYDTKVIYLNVNVTEDNGILSASTRYLDAIDGQEIEPVFTNQLEEVNLRVQKTSKDDSHDPLMGSVYGLWMANDNGRDVYLGANTSDEQGWIVFENIDVIEGAKYYFKEEHAPEGHLVDAYRSAMFSIVPDAAKGYRLVYESEDEFNDRDQGGNASGDVNADKY